MWFGVPDGQWCDRVIQAEGELVASLERLQQKLPVYADHESVGVVGRANVHSARGHGELADVIGDAVVVAGEGFGGAGAKCGA